VPASTTPELRARPKRTLALAAATVATAALTLGIAGTAQAANTAPVAHDDTYFLYGTDMPLVVNASKGVLANDTDADGDKSLSRDRSWSSFTAECGCLVISIRMTGCVG
jgi:hypothetical protein